MIKPFKYCFLFLFLFVFTGNLFSNQQRFDIKDAETAKRIENEIERYPNQIKFNLRYKLADFYQHTDLEKTVAYLELLISEIKETQNPRYNALLMNSYTFIGEIYQKSGSNYQSVNMFMNALDLAKKINNKLAEYKTLMRISDVLLKQSNHFMRLKYLKDAYSIANTFDDNSKYFIKSRIAFSFLQLNKLDSAENIVKALLVTNINQTLTAQNHILYSNILTLKNEHELSKAQLEKANNIAKELNSASLKYHYNYEMAKILALENRYKEAESYLKQTKEFSKNKDNILNLLSSAIIYEKNNKHKEANSYYKAYIEVSDSLLKEKYELASMNFIYLSQLQQKEMELSKLKVSNYQQNINVKKNRFLIIISFTLLLFLIIATYFIFNYQREKNKNLQLIAKQKEELTLKRHKEVVRKFELKAAVAQVQGQEIERERLAKELHDGVGGTLAGIKMELESFFSQFNKNPKFDYLLQMLNKTYLEVRSISKNLSFPNFNSESLHDNLKELIHNFPGKNELKISFDAYPKETWDNVDYSTQKELYRIIQEAITNVIKHAKASELDIQIVNDERILSLIIEDNGKGFDLKKTWSGIGIKNMYSRAELLKGELSLESKPGNGTTLNLSIPLKS